MRFIDRERLSPPDLLFGERAEKAQADVQGFIEQTYSKGGTRRAPRSFWLDDNDDFQGAMAAQFRGLCAYCESEAPFDPDTTRGVIARHRPEALAQDEEGNTDLLSYVWLMFEWENLLWTCSECARRKGNLFYIEGSRGEPSMPLEPLRRMESELFLDPCYHKAEQHLIFNVGGHISWRTRSGHATLDTLELNRPELVEGRRLAVLEVAALLRHMTDWQAEGQTLSEKLMGSDPSRGLPPHSGSATWAILELAAMLDIKAEGPEHFLQVFAEMSEAQRAEFLDELVDRAQPFETVESVVKMPPNLAANTDNLVPPQTPEPTTAKRNRILNIQTLPNALKPITRVKIENFKALREIAFDLPERVTDADQSPCMLLLGENAMGKSSVLEAMALAVIGAQEADALDGVLKEEDVSPMGLIHRPDPYFWHQTADDMCVQLDFLDTNTPIRLEAEAGDTSFSGTQDCAKVVLAYGPRRYFTSRTSRRLRAPAHRVRSLFDPMDMIANPIHWLATLDDPQFFAAARALREVLMLDDEDDFERDDNPDTPGQIYIWQNGQRVAMKDLSVGFKSVIAMVTDIIREMLYHFDNLEFASGVVFVDEIETHLHPRWKMRIMTLMRRAFPKVQFIVTTHDPLCLQGMYDGEVFVLHRDPHTDRVEPVSDLPSIRGMRAEQILTSEFFGLGSTDPETDARLARYNHLAAQIETLTRAETRELERLRAQLDDGMVLGSTLREQAYAEALKERDETRQISPTNARSPRRADLKAEFSSLFDIGGDR